MYTAYYKVWYRHSGEEEIDEIPDIDVIQYKRVEDVGEITTDIGDNYITHMSMKGKILPALSTVAPQLTHLKIQELYDNSQLERYVNGFNNSNGDNVIITYLIVGEGIYNYGEIFKFLLHRLHWFA